MAVILADARSTRLVAIGDRVAFRQTLARFSRAALDQATPLAALDADAGRIGSAVFNKGEVPSRIFVLGDGGLSAQAWNVHFDRYGAPQVTRRLRKAAGRPMGAHDWSLWIAGKALVGAALASAKKPADFARALADVELDGSKGVAMGFRPWDGQLRQPLILGDTGGVAALAPADGVLHPKNSLDTLGADAPEKLCKARS